MWEGVELQSQGQPHVWVLCETTIARTIRAFRTSKHKQRPHEGTLGLVLVPNRLVF
jgi:hypothetical protein